MDFYDRTGKRRQVSTGVRVESDPDGLEARRVAEVRQTAEAVLSVAGEVGYGPEVVGASMAGQSGGRFPLVPCPGGDPWNVELTAGACNAFLDHHPMAESTKVAWSSMLRSWSRVVGPGEPVARSLSQGQLEFYFGRLRSREGQSPGKSPGNRSGGDRHWNHVRSVLSLLCRFLVRKGVLPESMRGAVRRSIPTRKETRGEIRPLVPVEIAAVYRAAYAWRPLPPNVDFNDWPAIMRLLVETGLRPIELRHLQWKDVEVVHGARAGFVSVTGKPDFSYRPKNYCCRTVPVSDDLAMRLRKWRRSLPLDLSGDEHFILSVGRCADWPSGERREAFSWILNTALGPRGTNTREPKDIRLYLLRHTAAVRMVEATRDPRIAKTLLGHNCLQTTFIYVDHVEKGRAMEEARAALNEMSRVVKESPTPSLPGLNKAVRELGFDSDGKPLPETFDRFIKTIPEPGRREKKLSRKEARDLRRERLRQQRLMKFYEKADQYKPGQ